MSGARSVAPQRRLTSTWVRLTALSVAALAVALATSVLIAWRLAAVQGERALDGLVEREFRVFAATAPDLLAGVTPDRREEIGARLDTFLAVQPGTDRHLTLVAVEDYGTRITASGPEAVLRLYDRGDLPSGVSNRLVTIDTSEGRLRVLTAPLIIDGVTVGAFSVYGDLGAVDADAARVARQTGLAAAFAGLVGSVLLALAFRAATAPLRSLHDAADRAGVNDLSVRVPDPDGREDEVADLARAFNRMLGRLEVEVAARNALFASVSHELRTPVAVARGHLELLESGVARDPGESLRMVRDELGRLSRLLDDLMLLAAADGGTSFLAPQPMTRARLADEIALRLDGLGLGDVPVTVDAGSRPETEVMVDPDRMIQAAVNLAVNARRHTPPGTHAEVLVGGGGKDLVVMVRDEGQGIDPDLLDRVMEPFVGRGGRGSTGLGLAVVRAVAVAHHGWVTVDSRPTGTLFTVVVPGDRVPLARPGDRAVREVPAVTT